MDRDFGAYLNGGFLLGEHAGADILSIHWYDRNLRMHRNIKRVASSPEDRVLVLFGAGHMGILKHLATCDPLPNPSRSINLPESDVHPMHSDVHPIRACR